MPTKLAVKTAEEEALIRFALAWHKYWQTGGGGWSEADEKLDRAAARVLSERQKGKR
jgi:hypothetical protein